MEILAPSTWSVLNSTGLVQGDYKPTDEQLRAFRASSGSDVPPAGMKVIFSPTSISLIPMHMVIYNMDGSLELGLLPGMAPKRTPKQEARREYKAYLKREKRRLVAHPYVSKIANSSATYAAQLHPLVEPRPWRTSVSANRCYACEECRVINNARQVADYVGTCIEAGPKVTLARVKCAAARNCIYAHVAKHIARLYEQAEHSNRGLPKYDFMEKLVACQDSMSAPLKAWGRTVRGMFNSKQIAAEGRGGVGSQLWSPNYRFIQRWCTATARQHGAKEHSLPVGV